MIIKIFSKYYVCTMPRGRGGWDGGREQVQTVGEGDPSIVDAPWVIRREIKNKTVLLLGYFYTSVAICREGLSFFPFLYSYGKLNYSRTLMFNDRTEISILFIYC